MITREAIVAEARSWVGTRWQHATSLKGVATDCIGLITGVGRALCIAQAFSFMRDARFQGYGRTPNVSLLRQALALYLDPTEHALPGDILLLRFATEPQHFAILSAPDYMIHAYAPARVVAEHRIDPKWQRRIVGAYRYPGVV